MVKVESHKGHSWEISQYYRDEKTGVGEGKVNCHTESTLETSSSSRRLLKITKNQITFKIPRKSDLQDTIFVQDLIIEGYKTILIKPPKLFQNMFPMHEFGEYVATYFQHKPKMNCWRQGKMI